MISDPNENTLLAFRYNRLFRAERGRHGEGSDCHGRSGPDTRIRVPVGTLVYDEETGALLHDFDRTEDEWLAAEGGRGGRGNARFASSVNRTPRKAENGGEGEERHLRLELKLLADVGLVGFPNAGKSTLISSISAARPKIADYPFTTLQPNLGVVAAGDYRTFVVAYITRLIEGAHTGQGLGIQFLRHIELTRLLIYLIDVSVAEERNPVDQLRVLRHELREHDRELAGRSFIVVASKMDSADPARLDELEQWCRQENARFAKISSITGEGLEGLKHIVVRELGLAGA
jgi:GTP-binding protein